MSNPIPLTPPSGSYFPYADTTLTGPQILPHKRIESYNSVEWEEFVREWAYVQKSQYSRVERSGGAGDMGRDVIAWPDANYLAIWDNFQCKHYNHALYPSEAWLEFGKLVYYTYRRIFISQIIFICCSTWCRYKSF